MNRSVSAILVAAAVEESLRHDPIVGGSIAAVESHRGSVTLLSDERHAPYLRVPLSKAVLAGAQEPDSVTGSAVGDDVDVRLGARAVGLDLGRRQVRVPEAEPVAFDKVVVDFADVSVRVRTDCGSQKIS